LDPQARRHLWDIVFQLKQKNKTIVLTTHYMEEAQLLCDYIAIMDHGKFIAEGVPSELLAEYCQTTSIILPGVSAPDLLDDFQQGSIVAEYNTVEIQTTDVNRCLKELMEKGIDLSGVSIRSQNLEDLFLKLTGHGLR